MQPKSLSLGIRREQKCMVLGGSAECVKVACQLCHYRDDVPVIASPIEPDVHAQKATIFKKFKSLNKLAEFLHFQIQNLGRVHQVAHYAYTF